MSSKNLQSDISRVLSYFSAYNFVSAFSPSLAASLNIVESFALFIGISIMRSRFIIFSILSKVFNLLCVNSALYIFPFTMPRYDLRIRFL